MIQGIIDLDNVVSEWLFWVMEQQSEVPKLAGLRSGRLDEMWDLTDQQVDDIVQDLRGYTEADVVPGAYEGLWTLWHDPRVDFIYVSASPKAATAGRHQWFQRNYLPIDEHRLIQLGNGADKEDWIHDHGETYDFILDDFLAPLDAALLAGIELRMAFHRPWNVQEEENHQRVHNWKQVVDLIQQQASE
jgi:hypothetical protein